MGPTLALPPLSLYVHVPWCVRKCPYCDFNSHRLRSELPEAAYLEALLRDLESVQFQVQGRSLVSVFIGGGTPSLLSAGAVGALLEAIDLRIRGLEQAEVTLEANPGTVDANRFKGYRSAGVNRLSLGIQSFQDSHLAALGRIHDSEQAQHAIAAAQACFERINLDLMYGLPHQTLAQALQDVETALAWGPTHLSCYQLTMEPNTLFGRTPPPVPDLDQSAAMGDAIELRLEAAGFEHYEVSGFARPGAVCRHNLNYWEFGDYLGIGAGAHAKWTSLQEGVWRQWREPHPTHYLRGMTQGNAVQGQSRVENSELPFEFMLNGLRLRSGISWGYYAQRTGLDPQLLWPKARELQTRGLLESEPGLWRATALGRRFLNEVVAAFLPTQE